MNPRNLSFEDYFIRINSYDLLPLVTKIAEDLGYRPRGDD
jgi:hypothetical protein